MIPTGVPTELGRADKQVFAKMRMKISLKECLAEYSEPDDTYPALCSEACQVELDRHCEQGVCNFC